MNTNLAKWGNSAAIRIPKAVLEELNSIITVVPITNSASTFSMPYMKSY